MSTDVPPTPAEAWLVLRAQAGSREHLERLMVTTQQFLSPRLAPLLDSQSDVEDLLQDVLFTICRRLWTLNDVRLYRPWVHRIAMRAAWKVLNRRRRERAREGEVDVDAIAAAPSPDLIDVAPLLDRVSPASRVVLTLHYLEGMTLEATAAELGVAPGTIKSRLAYGLKQLRAVLPNAQR